MHDHLWLLCGQILHRVVQSLPASRGLDGWAAWKAVPGPAGKGTFKAIDGADMTGTPPHPARSHWQP